MLGKVGSAYRYFFTARTGSGAARTGLVTANFTITVRNPGNTATLAAPTVTEVGAGLYFFDVAGAFTTTHGAGQYGVTISVILAPLDTIGDSIDFFVNNLDDLATPTSVWSTALPGAFGAGSAGFIIGTNLDVLVSSRATQAQILSDATPFAGANIDAAISSRATQAQILSDATPFPGANINATISSRSSHSAADVDTVLSGTHGAGSWATATGFAIPGDAMALTAGALAAIDVTLSASHGAGLWDATANVAAIVAGVWSEALPGAFGAGSAGFILGTNLNALITSRSSHSAADVDTTLTGSHGTGSWQTATGFSTLTIADVQTAMTAQGYTTARAPNLDNLDATISSVNAAIGALNDISALDVWNVDLDANFIVPQRNLAGGALLLERMMTTNRLEETSGTPGVVRLFDDAATTVELTWQVRPQTGNTIGEILGSPARRSVAA